MGLETIVEDIESIQKRLLEIRAFTDAIQGAGIRVIALDVARYGQSARLQIDNGIESLMAACGVKAYEYNKGGYELSDGSIYPGHVCFKFGEMEIIQLAEDDGTFKEVREND